MPMPAPRRHPKTRHQAELERPPFSTRSPWNRRRRHCARLDYSARNGGASRRARLCQAARLRLHDTRVHFRSWLKAAVQRCPLGLPLLAYKQTFVGQCPLFDLFRLLHPQEQTFLTVPPKVRS